LLIVFPTVGLDEDNEVAAVFLLTGPLEDCCTAAGDDVGCVGHRVVGSVIGYKRTERSRAETASSEACGVEIFQTSITGYAVHSGRISGGCSQRPNATYEPTEGVIGEMSADVRETGV
jgi:hypothetical protein